MKRSWIYAAGITAGLALGGCVVPSEVREKIAVEAEVHRGYERFVDVAPIESLRAIVRKSGKAWIVLDSVVNPTEDVSGE